MSGIDQSLERARGTLHPSSKRAASSDPPSQATGSADLDDAFDALHVRESRQQESVVDTFGSDPAYRSLQTKFQEELPQSKVTFSFSNLSLSADARDAQGNKFRQDILKDVSGIVGPGESLAIMGASGAGKTVLLNILSGRLNPDGLEGEVLVDGVPRPANWVRISKYVSASDDLIPTMTVREQLRFAAELQLPSTFTGKEKDLVVSYTIRALGLDTCADTKVGGGLIRGISGGQRRRTILGIELLCQPRVLFLDVPTNGLDSTAATAVMKGLFDMCSHQQSSIICSIQAPSAKVFAQFRKVMLLWKGQVVFYGPPSKAETFFAEVNHPMPALVNPSDHYMHVINTDFEEGSTVQEVQAIVDHYRKSDTYAQAMEEVEEEPRRLANGGGPSLKLRSLEPSANGVWRQFYALWKRANVDSVRNITNYWLRIAALSMQALVIGTVYLDIGFQEVAVTDRVATLFFIAGFFPFLAIAGVPTYLQERSVFQRERGNGTYGAAAYALASILSNIYWLALLSTIVASIVYFLVGLHEGRFGYFLLVLFILLFTAESFMAFLSSVVPDFVVGLAAASCVHSLFTLFAGFLLPRPQIGGWWIWLHYISYGTFSFSGLLSNDLSGLTFNCDGSQSFPEFCPNGATGTFTGEQVLSTYDISTDTQVRDPLVLFALGVGFRILSVLPGPAVHEAKPLTGRIRMLSLTSKACQGWGGIGTGERNNEGEGEA